MSARQRALIDGQGARRAAAAIAGLFGAGRGRAA
jgi:hypothetical protein